MSTVSDNAVNLIFFRSLDKFPSVFFMIHLNSSFSDNINKSIVSIPVSLAMMGNIGTQIILMEQPFWKSQTGLIILVVFVSFEL